MQKVIHFMQKVFAGNYFKFVSLKGKNYAQIVESKKLCPHTGFAYRF